MFAQPQIEECSSWLEPIVLHASSYVGKCAAAKQLPVMLPGLVCSSRREVRATALAVLQCRAASLPDLEVELCHNTRLLRELLGGIDEGVQANALAILASLLPKLDAHAVGRLWAFAVLKPVQPAGHHHVVLSCLLSAPSLLSMSVPLLQQTHCSCSACA